MALADILKRIDGDAVSEADAIIMAAETDAERMRREAQVAGEAARTSEVSRAEREAAEDAKTRLASARLRGRDRVLTEKRVLIERALATAKDHILALPDDRYTALLARELVAVARGGERVLLGRADSARLSGLQVLLDEADAGVRVDGETDAIEHGVLLEGSRMRVDVSPESMLAARRAELEARVSEVLFGGADE